jgi:hypothetical protein
MPVTEREPAPLERLLDGFDDLVLYRYPHVVGPPFIACVLLGVAWLAHWGGGGAATLATVVACVVVFLALDSVAELPGAREKTYALICWLGGGSWVILAAWFGPFSAPLPWVSEWLGYPVPVLLAAWAVMLVTLMPPWTKHRRVRRSAEVSREILAWDGDAVGLPEVSLSTAGAKADADGWEAPLIPDTPGKWTTDKLRRALPNIAARYEAATHEFSIDKVRGDKEGKWVLRYRKARKREPVLYVPPTERPSAREPFTIGHVTSDPTKPLQAEVWRKGHGGVDSLITGQKGYGKTRAFQRVALHAISSRDAVLFLGDMKPGSPDHHEIGSRGAYLYATTAAEIDAMILVLLALCKIRGRNKRRNRKVIVAEFDETALYFAPTPPAGDTPGDRARAFRIDEQRKAQFENLANVSRAYDMSIWLAVQKGKEKNTGGDARSAISAGQVIGFYAPKVSDGTLVSADAAFDPTRLPRGVPGQCFVSNGLHPEVIRGTLWNVTEATIRDVLDRFAKDTGALDDDEVEALREEFGERWDELRKANRKGAALPLDDEPEESAAPVPPPAPQGRAMTADQSRDYVWQSLAEFNKPASGKDVAERVGKSEQLTRARLNELVAAGRAVRHGQGRWVKFEAVRVRERS